MNDLNPRGWNRREVKELNQFWINRYRDNPESLHPGLTVGGSGFFDASKHSQDNPANLPRSYFDHPTQIAFRERQAALNAELKVCQAEDRKRLRLLATAETAVMQSWQQQGEVDLAKRKVQSGKLDRSALTHQRESLQEFETTQLKAVEDLVSYDQAHAHPIANPDRDLQRDPPNGQERQQWLTRGNRQVANSPAEQQAWQDNDRTVNREEFDRPVPESKGLVPQDLHNRVHRAQNLERLLGQTHAEAGREIAAKPVQRPKLEAPQAVHPANQVNTAKPAVTPSARSAVTPDERQRMEAIAKRLQAQPFPQREPAKVIPQFAHVKAEKVPAKAMMEDQDRQPKPSFIARCKVYAVEVRQKVENWFKPGELVQKREQKREQYPKAKASVAHLREKPPEVQVTNPYKDLSFPQRPSAQKPQHEQKPEMQRQAQAMPQRPSNKPQAPKPPAPRPTVGGPRFAMG